MLTTPVPVGIGCIMSSKLSIGSPKNTSAPWASSASRPRWIAPIEAADTLPYSVVKSLALSPTTAASRAGPWVEQQQPALVGELEHQVQHTFLGLVQAEHARQQQRPHVGHRGAQRNGRFRRTRPRR
jgi:hypothetical protein